MGTQRYGKRKTTRKGLGSNGRKKIIDTGALWDKKQKSDEVARLLYRESNSFPHWVRGPGSQPSAYRPQETQRQKMT